VPCVEVHALEPVEAWTTDFTGCTDGRGERRPQSGEPAAAPAPGDEGADGGPAEVGEGGDFALREELFVQQHKIDGE